VSDSKPVWAKIVTENRRDKRSDTTVLFIENLPFFTTKESFVPMAVAHQSSSWWTLQAMPAGFLSEQTTTKVVSA